LGYEIFSSAPIRQSAVRQGRKLFPGLFCSLCDSRPRFSEAGVENHQRNYVFLFPCRHIHSLFSAAILRPRCAALSGRALDSH
jgi:hypothetical protein